ncbi:MAG: sensor histidine kinase [Stenotrophomonas sp.]
MTNGSPPSSPPPRPTITPLDTLWKAPTLIWTILAGEALAIILALAPETSGSRWVMFGALSLMVQWVSLSTLGALYLLRRPLSRLPPTLVANISLLLLVACSVLVCIACWWVLKTLLPMSAGNWLSALLRFTGIVLIFGLLGLAAFQNHWRARQLAVRTKQAELEALQARIRPHFLFNTLNTGAALVHQRPEDVEHLLLDLADLFRAALAGPDQVPLVDEIALIQRYVEIEKLRFGERMRITWDVPQPLPTTSLPTLSLQPLIENAIRYGVEPMTEGGDITIHICLHDKQVRITIDNPLPPAGYLPRRGGHKVGLESARARIQALTEGRGDVTTQSINGRHITTVTLPA